MIISASRRTDIPNYYSEWFCNRLKEGFLDTRNPVNSRQVSRIPLSPDVVDGIVFWTKNPENMLGRLGALKGFPYYFQFTLTGYGGEIEPGLPEKQRLIHTFHRLSELIGKERVIWRYDPILLSPKHTVSYHEAAFQELAEQLCGYTQKVVISFLDIYQKVKKPLEYRQIRRPVQSEMERLAASISYTASKNGLQVESCAESIDLARFGIARGHCIDRQLIEALTGSTLAARKDPNQRKECGCLESIDVGAYNTCKNGCVYCYANVSREGATHRWRSYDPSSPLLCGALSENDTLIWKEGKSLKTEQLRFYP